MSVEKLLSALDKEAELKEKKVLEKAEREADEIERKAFVDIERIRTEAVKLEENIAAENKTLAKAAKRIASRSKRLKAEQVVISSLFSRCEELYTDFQKRGDFRRFIEGEYNKAVSELGAVTEVIADETTATVLKGIQGLKVRIDKNIGNGFTVIDENGAAVSSLFENRLEKLWRTEAPLFVKRIHEAVLHEC